MLHFYTPNNLLLCAMKGLLVYNIEWRPLKRHPSRLSSFLRYFFTVMLLIATPICQLHARIDYALIAGGSRGIGYSIAEALAKRGWNLILVARHTDDLEQAKAKLESNYKVHVDILAKDLSKEETPAEIASWCDQKQIPLRMLCNVAGFGGARDYLQLPADTIRYMLRLNLESGVMLTYALLPLLERNAKSYLLNVASMAGMGPMPSKNIYSATKAGVMYFSYSLRYQLKKKGISVSCLAPGPVYTKQEVINTTHKEMGKRLGDWIEVPPARVGEIAVRRTLKGRMVIVPGTVAAISSSMIRILPRRWAAALYGTGKQ
jgi:short-subunit dehydrogenase